MSGLEVFFLILILVEFVILMYLFASLRKLREAHRVVSEMALDDAEAFTGSLARAREQDDIERAKLIIEEAERYLTSYRSTLQKHYDRYSTEKSLSDFLPFLKKRKETVSQTSRATSFKFSKTKKTVPTRESKEEPSVEPMAEVEEALSSVEEESVLEELEDAPPSVEKEEVTTPKPKPLIKKPARKRGRRGGSKKTAEQGAVGSSEDVETVESDDDLLPPPD